MVFGLGNSCGYGCAHGYAYAIKVSSLVSRLYSVVLWFVLLSVLCPLAYLGWFFSSSMNIMWSFPFLYYSGWMLLLD